MRFSNNAYLIKHGDDWLLWDTGLLDDLIETPGGKVVVHDTKQVASQLHGLVGKPGEILYNALLPAYCKYV